MKSKSAESGKLFVIAAAFLVAWLAFATTICPSSAFAEGESAPSEDKLISELKSQTDPTNPDTPPFGGLPLMGNDYVWYGRGLTLQKHTVANDLIAAGQTVNLDAMKVGGSFRIAAQDVEISNATAAENITVAAERVIIKDTTANSVAAAGRTVSVSGSCKELTAFADKVYINGVVEGDVAVTAGTVEVMNGARIAGTLHVSGQMQPVIQQGAEIGKVDFTQAESSPSPNFVGVLAAMSPVILIMLAILGLVGTIIMSVLAEWLFRRHTAAAAEMIRTRTGATIGSGIIGALVAPLVILILLFVMLPIAAVLALVLIAMSIVAEGFMGASLFKLAFPNLGRFKCALAGGAIVGVAGAIPILGAIVGAAAFMYLLGYVLQSIFLGMRSEGGTPQATPPMPSTPTAPATPESPARPVPPAPPTPPIQPLQ
ncbi:MAG: hypothetical protein IJ087_13265 [Eggerthellaceae bacterium]|nr:hypothetical protein [Eggerthellaceae bacterium]